MSQTYKDFEIEEHKRMGASDIEFSFYTVKGFTGREFVSIQSAKVAITKHLTKKSEFDRINALPNIEVVPRTQQEIDDYGPNGIQPPKLRILVAADSYKLVHDLPKLRITESRNKREGGYCGRYKADNKNFKIAHYRVGPLCNYETLEETAKYKKRLFPLICPVSGQPLQQRRKA